uniref:Pinhead n=1 Tax=Oryzias sinensis TaxID=183150 RepID=A0A8C7ZCK1_9TELE
MDAPQHLLLLLTLSGVLSRPSDHRNLFTQRACCRRQSHVVFIGQDISGGPVSVDVGLCRSHCGAAGGSSQARGLQEQSWSILDFLRSKKRRARGPPPPESTPPHNPLPSCGMNQVCAPAGVRVERVLLFEGPREVEVIQECHCEVRLSQCMRVPALKTYFSETPHEAVLDVGGCSRSKGSPEGFSCLPSRFDSVLVETPNRVEQVQTVVDCELKETCYRVPHVEYYYEIVHHENGVKEEKLRVSENVPKHSRSASKRSFMNYSSWIRRSDPRGTAPTSHPFVIQQAGRGFSAGCQTAMGGLFIRQHVVFLLMTSWL